MFADLLIVIMCIGVAIYGAWNTALIRHKHDIAHKRQRTDH